MISCLLGHVFCKSRFKSVAEDHEMENIDVTPLELEKKGLLKEIAFDRNAAAVYLRTSECSFELDLRGVASVDIRDMFNVLKLMNFDGRIKISRLQ